MRIKKSTLPPIQPEAYVTDYYASDCDGHEEFKASRGAILPKRIAHPLHLAQLKTGMRVLDLGCGRGELVLHAALAGTLAYGLDYAQAALDFTKNLTTDHAQQAMAFQRAHTEWLPFANKSFDVVFMLDIVEHLHPHELAATLDEVWRVLKNDGKVLIHTMPNLWYYKIGYPIYRFFQRLRGQKLPKDPRARGTYAHLHVNEQTLWQLKKTLRSSRLQTRVWLEDVQDYSREPNPIVRQGMRLLTNKAPLKWVFCNDILAIGIKRP